MTLLIAWLLYHRKSLFKAILGLSAASLLVWGIVTHKQNKKLSEELEMAQNNIEAYLGSLQGSLLATNVLRLTVLDLQQQNDILVKLIDSVRNELNIKPKNVRTAATQTQSIFVSTSESTQGDLLEVLKDTVYKDSILYNLYTNIKYLISKDSVWFTLDVKNTQYLFVYYTKEYKNKKNFFKRLFTLDFKKVTRARYEITNSNPIINTSDVKIIEINN